MNAHEARGLRVWRAWKREVGVRKSWLWLFVIVFL